MKSGVSFVNYKVNLTYNEIVDVLVCGGVFDSGQGLVSVIPTLTAA